MTLTITDQRAAGDPSLEYYPRMTTWEQVHATFGLEILTSLGWDATQPGELCWKLTGFNVRTGAAIFFPRVLGLLGNPYWHAPTSTGALVFHTWAGCPDFEHPDPLRPDYNPLLEARIGGGFRTHHALANWSKQENGDADFAYGHGMIGGPDGGPGVLWVSAVPPHVPKTEGAHYSDCVARLGWIGGTDHLTASPVFRLTRKESTTPPPPDNATEYLVNVAADGTPTGYLAFTPGAPPTSVPPPLPTGGGLALMRGGQVVAYIPWQAV